MARARPLILTLSSFRSSSRILPGCIGGSFTTLVVVDDFDIVCSLLFPLETNSELVVDPDTMLPGPIARKSLQTITPKRRQIRQRLRRIQANESRACLIFDVNEFNNALIIRESFRPSVLERADHTSKILPDG